MQKHKHGSAALAATLLFVVAGPSLARADWQYTRWGMTEEQVAEAAQGSAWVPQKPDQYGDRQLYNLLDSNYTAGKFRFLVKFIFDGQEKLAMVQLQPPDRAQCPSLRGTLEALYGPAEITRTPLGRMDRWWDNANGNSVALADLPSWCTLQYAPLVRSGQRGGL